MVIVVEGELSEKKTFAGTEYPQSLASKLCIEAEQVEIIIDLRILVVVVIDQLIVKVPFCDDLLFA